MEEHLIHDFQHLVVYLTLATALATGLFFLMKNRKKNIGRTDHALKFFSKLKNKDTTAFEKNDDKSDTLPDFSPDTIFILPDISHYSRFIAGDHFDNATAHHIVFSLISSMIKAGTKTFDLSKLEGDAVLLYADAKRNSKAVVGQTIVDILCSFAREKERLMNSDLCSCQHCFHIDLLDIKILVHRGRSIPFKFLGSIDHFGKDVTLIHKLVKNNIYYNNYVLITNEASDLVSMPENFLVEKKLLEIQGMPDVEVEVYTKYDLYSDDISSSVSGEVK